MQRGQSTRGIAGRRKDDSVRRIVVVAISVVLALAIAVPAATAQQTAKKGQLNKKEVTGQWWNWAASIDPSPVYGSYEGGEQCDGSFVEGVFFLAGLSGESPVERTCTVPADTPILFPVVNVVCSEEFDPPDPAPYGKCAKNYTNQILDGDSTTFATVDGENVKKKRINSGTFSWTIETADNPYPTLDPGTHDSGSDGLWVFLKKGLPAGDHTVEFGGNFVDTPFGDLTADVTYNLVVVPE